MSPLRLSNVWNRRFYTGALLVSLSLLIIFTLDITNLSPSSSALTINPIIAVLALIVAATSAVLIFVQEKLKSNIPAIAVYILLLAIVGITVWQTGGEASPYLALWSLVVLFAAVFGAFGWIPVVALIGAHIAASYISTGLTSQTIMVALLSSILPLVAGLFIWRETDQPDNPSEKNIKNLTSQLSEVASKSEIVINAIGDGVIALDSQGVIQLINPAAQQILGWGKQDALMLNYKSILKLADENNNPLEQSTDPIAQVLNTNQQTRGNKLVAITKSNKKINVALVVSPIGEAGAGVIIVFRDVTGERAEEREQAEFISTASHEMRTPVASIEGYLGLAMNPSTATIDQRAKDFIQKAHEAAQHLGRLFQDLLDVSKSEDGRMTSVPKVVDMVLFTQSIAQGLTPKAVEKGLEIIFVPTQANSLKKIMPVYYVNQDNDHIREIIDNLIENAIKYTRKGSITIDVTGDDDRVTVSVKDSGLGIPAEDVSHLFQKFYRVNNADRQDIGGTGLGLYLSRRLAESMQGNLRVESVFGQGSTFLLDLPRIDSQSAVDLKASQNQSQNQQVAQTPQPSSESEIETPTIQAATAPSQSPNQGPPSNQTSLETPPGVAPAKNVPRGESLTADQKAARVRQLEEFAKQQRGSIAPPPREQ